MERIEVPPNSYETNRFRIEIRKLRNENTNLWVEIGGLRKEINKLNSIMDKNNVKENKYIFTIEDYIYGQDGDITKI